MQMAQELGFHILMESERILADRGQMLFIPSPLTPRKL
jgi:hypothetical protein